MTNSIKLTAADTKKVTAIKLGAAGIFAANDVYKSQVMEYARALLESGFLPDYLSGKAKQETPFSKACYIAVQDAAIESLPAGERKDVCLMPTKTMSKEQTKLRRTVMDGTVRAKVAVIAHAMALATPELDDSKKLIAKNEASRKVRKDREAKRRATIAATVEAAKKAKPADTRAPQQPVAKPSDVAAAAAEKVEADKANIPYYTVARNSVVKVVNDLKQKGKSMTEADKIYAVALKEATTTYDAAVKALAK